MNGTDGALTMTTEFYAISIQPNRVVATEVDPAEVAVLFDAAHSVLLAAPVDLVRLALRLGKPLKIFNREDVLYCCQAPTPAKACRHRAACV